MMFPFLFYFFVTVMFPFNLTTRAQKRKWTTDTCPGKLGCIKLAQAISKAIIQLRFKSTGHELLLRTHTR